MGGSHERSGPYKPFRQRHFKFGKSLSQRSNTNSGAAQSSPMSMTRDRASPGVARKAASRVDSGENRFFKSLRYQAMNAHWCIVTERTSIDVALLPSSRDTEGQCGFVDRQKPRGYPESPYVLQADIKPMILER